MLSFPKPPPALVIENPTKWDAPLFAPAHDVAEWARETFLNADSPLFNPDHEHLGEADILFLWSSVYFKRTGQRVAGTAQLGKQMAGGPGKKQFIEAMYTALNFGKLPDFVITLCVPYVVEASPAEICALVEHEMYHCAQETIDDVPQITAEGPKWAMRGHDVEEFVGVVARYGAMGAVKELVDAASLPPILARKSVETAVCGCGARL